MSSTPHNQKIRLRDRRAWLATMSATGLSMQLFSSVQPLLADESVAKWPFEATAGAFRIHADFEIATQADLTTELEQLGSDVAKLLEIQLPQRTVHIVIFSSPDEYRRYMSHYYPALPERRALFIQQRGTAMLFAHCHADLATDLRHETVHAILNDSTDALPLWMDEGLAEYFEAPAAQRWSGHAHLQTLKVLADSSQWPELSALESIEDVSSMTGEHYQAAWLWVHFLLHRRQSTRRLLVEHLQHLRAGQNLPPLSRTVSQQLPAWRDEFGDHFKRLK